MLIVGIIIVKAIAIVAPKHAFTKSELDNHLALVDTSITDGLRLGLQREVDATVNMLVTINTALGLFQAARGEFGVNSDINPNEPVILLAAFDSQEAGDDGQGGEIQQSKTAIASVLDLNLGEALCEELSPTTLFRASAKTLHLYFKEMAKLPPDFQVESCLDTCRKTAQRANVRAPHLLTALALIRSVLEEGNLDIGEVWLSNPPDTSDKTWNWLSARLGTGALSEQVAAVYGSNDPDKDEAKRALSRIAKMLDKNDYFFGRIRNRLDLLQEEIAGLPGDSSAEKEQKDAWVQLVQAMYGAVAWRIFRQARIAAWETQTVLTLADRS